MRLPRDLAGEELARRLGRIGYVVTRETGSHMRLTTQVNGEHHVTIPQHGMIKVGALSAILRSGAGHRDVTIAELLLEIGPC